MTQVGGKRAEGQDPMKMGLRRQKQQRFSAIMEMPPNSIVDISNPSLSSAFASSTKKNKFFDKESLKNLEVRIPVAERFHKQRKDFLDYFDRNVELSQMRLENHANNDFVEVNRNAGQFFRNIPPYFPQAEDQGENKELSVHEAILMSLVNPLALRRRELIENQHFKDYINIDFKSIENNVLRKIKKNRLTPQKSYMIDQICNITDGVENKYIPSTYVSDQFTISKTALGRDQLNSIFPCENILYTFECSDNLFHPAFARDLTTIARDMVGGSTAHREELEERCWIEIQKEEIKHDLAKFVIFDCINIIAGRVSTQMLKKFLEHSSWDELLKDFNDQSFNSLASVYTEELQISEEGGHLEGEKEQHSGSKGKNKPPESRKKTWTPLDVEDSSLLQENLQEDEKHSDFKRNLPKKPDYMMFDRFSYKYYQRPKEAKLKHENGTQLNYTEINRPMRSIDNILETLSHCKTAMENAKLLPNVPSTSALKQSIIKTEETALEDMLNYLWSFVDGNEHMIVGHQDKLRHIVNSAQKENKKLYINSFPYMELIQIFIKEMIALKNIDKMKISKALQIFSSDSIELNK